MYTVYTYDMSIYVYVLKYVYKTYTSTYVYTYIYLSIYIYLFIYVLMFLRCIKNMCVHITQRARLLGFWPTSPESTNSGGPNPVLQHRLGAGEGGLSGLGFRVWCLGFKVQGQRVRVQGFESFGLLHNDVTNTKSCPSHSMAVGLPRGLGLPRIRAWGEMNFSYLGVGG